MKEYKSLLLFSEENQFFNDLKDSDCFGESGPTVVSVEEELEESDVKAKINENDYALLGGSETMRASRVVKRRSVGSHFLNYIDFIYKKDGELWGESIFSRVFREVLLRSIKNQDFKGPVIFLGHSPLSLPIIEVLSGFGFEDFVFLSLNSAKLDTAQYEASATGLINTKVSHVDSTAFIQSQKEYSFCFVMEDHYSRQTLEDMSYFHFLSSQSIVYDLSGRSNFFFDEVIALGVTLTEFSWVKEEWLRVIKDRIQKLP